MKSHVYLALTGIKTWIPLALNGKTLSFPHIIPPLLIYHESHNEHFYLSFFYSLKKKTVTISVFNIPPIQVIVIVTTQPCHLTAEGREITCR